MLYHFPKKSFNRPAYDRGYIVKDLPERLPQKSTQIITPTKRNRKNLVIEVGNALLLRQRTVVTTAIGLLKRICPIGYARHRNVPNFVTNLRRALIAYRLFPDRLRTHLEK